jgi:lysophospholipase L1-like esterase|tara:strand:- start:1206 stop:1868 length:663 start_codon:yes stop_codon:yes gene_type:complete
MKNYSKSFLILFSFFIIEGCSKSPDDIKYLALGDSYTIGENVEVKDSWPNQLSQRLEKFYNYSIETKIVAKTGYTTNELIEKINKTTINTDYDYVSLLIGVNNQYRELDIRVFEEELNILIDKSINFARGRSDKVFVLSIPDWGVTPFAELKEITKISEEIDNYNRLVEKTCLEKGVKYYYITDISRKVNLIDGLLANDGLHPSALMYSMWVDEVIEFFN